MGLKWTEPSKLATWRTSCWLCITLASRITFENNHYVILNTGLNVEQKITVKTSPLIVPK